MLTSNGAENDVNGLTISELGKAFQSLGAVYALNLDGGGSTTTWELANESHADDSVEGGHYVNHPTCNDTLWPECERTVASVVCIK